MKNLTCLLFLSFVVFSSTAQTLSIGARAGADFWMVQEHGRSFFNSGMNGQNTSFDPSVFLRYETKKHFAYEFALNHTRTSFSTWGTWRSEYYGNTTTFQTVNNQTSSVALSFAIQYNVTCIFGCANQGRFKDYVGFILSPTIYQDDSREYLSYSDNRPPNETRNSSKNFDFWLGVSNNMSYGIGKHINITSAVSFQTSPVTYPTESFTRYARYNADSRLAIQLGVAYKLN